MATHVNIDVTHAINIPGLPHPFLHTASNLNLDGGRLGNETWVTHMQQHVLHL